MTTSEVHRMLRNPIYTGDFRCCGTRRKGSHQPLITHDIINRVQKVLGGTARPRKARRYAFMGLLTCAKCGCSLTAEMKKGRYVYYHCTNFRGRCDNSHIREERLGELLGDVIKPIQISTEIADAIAGVLRGSDVDARRVRADSLRCLDQRRRVVLARQDRAYEDFSEGRISQDFWTRKSVTWEAELRAVAMEEARLDAPRESVAVTGKRILELAKQAENLYKSQDPAEQRQLLETVLSNCTFDCGTLTPTYTSPFDLLVKGNQTGNWRREWDSNPR